MGKYKNKFIDLKPQELCLMCGKCCRVVTTPISIEELAKLAKEGDESAKDFLDLFEPYESIQKAKKIDERTVNNILDALGEDDIYSGSYNNQNITFYKCRYILDNNLCSIYKNRKEVCDRFPSSPWCVTPPECGFEGWIDQQRKIFIEKIRTQKGNLLVLEELYANATTDEQRERIKITRNNLQNTINSFAKYGSEHW